MMATGGGDQLGYEDNRFEIVVYQAFHCPICLLVLREPLMCKNQHYYCSSCIKKHLANFAFCPTCREPLTVDELSQPPRIVLEYLSELIIHCDFYAKGCREVIHICDLKRHVANCEFAFVPNDVCSKILINMKNGLYHQAEVCDLRTLKCHECGELKTEMNQMRNQTLARQNEMKNEMKVIIDQVLARQDRMQDMITNGIKAEMRNEMKGIVTNALRDAMAGKIDLDVAIKNSAIIIVTGGACKDGEKFVRNKSTECFNWAQQTWIRLDSAEFESRSNACSFLYQGEMIMAGGSDGTNRTNTLKSLNVADPSATWKDLAVNCNLPVMCESHKVVVYNDRLFMSGGWIRSGIGPRRVSRSAAVYELQLVPPHSSKILTRLPQPRSSHGMELFDQKLFILGGREVQDVSSSVLQYDFFHNECKEMPPLPYAVQEMATVLWRNNVLVLGGVDEHGTCLNTVIMYDVITGRSQLLPSMKRKRRGCTAVIIGNVVVVMGGYGGESLQSVECFDLQRQVWQDLPDLLEPRAYATAAVSRKH